jgi:hypothetical protein
LVRRGLFDASLLLLRSPNRACLRAISISSSTVGDAATALNSLLLHNRDYAFSVQSLCTLNVQVRCCASSPQLLQPGQRLRMLS